MLTFKRETDADHSTITTIGRKVEFFNFSSCLRVAHLSHFIFCWNTNKAHLVSEFFPCGLLVSTALHLHRLTNSGVMYENTFLTEFTNYKKLHVFTTSRYLTIENSMLLLADFKHSPRLDL